MLDPQKVMAAVGGMVSSLAAIEAMSPDAEAQALATKALDDTVELVPMFADNVATMRQTVRAMKPAPAPEPIPVAAPPTDAAAGTP